MTSTEPMTYKPGPALDRIVAEKVMGYTVFNHISALGGASHYILICDEGEPVIWDDFHNTEEEAWASCPKFSTEWNAMQKVVYRMAHNKFEFTLKHYEGIDGWWWAAIFSNWKKHSYVRDKPEHAACLAALSALQHVSNTQEDKDA